MAAAVQTMATEQLRPSTPGALPGEGLLEREASKGPVYPRCHSHLAGQMRLLTGADEESRASALVRYMCRAGPPFSW